MKCSDVRNVLNDLSDILRAARADSETVAALRAVGEAIAVKPGASVAEYLKKVGDGTLAPSGKTGEAGLVADVLGNTKPLVTKCGKAGIASDLALICAFLDTYRHAAASDLRSQGELKLNLSASRGQKGAPPAPVRSDLVDRYNRKLEEALGDEPGFQSLFDRLSSDKEMGKLEVIALAKRFAAASSTSRTTALKKIWSRQQNLINVRVRNESRSGRTAA